MTSEEPARLAEACLRELVGRASFGHIRSVLRPVLTHFDRHELWIPNDFAVHTFKIIMFSIQAQYSYSVVEALMQHLDAGGNNTGDARDNTRVRAARATVLSNIVAIAAGDSVGPSVLEIINNLLTNLRASVARDSEKETDEKLYQEALINALGEFADHLPDFQKIDIMMFIVNKVPSSQRAHKPTRADAMLQGILLKSLLKVRLTSIHSSRVNKVPSSQRAHKPTRADAMLQGILLKSLLKVRLTSIHSSRVNKVPSSQRAHKPTRADAMLQGILLKSLLKVGTTYRTTELSKAFPAAFLEALLRVAAAGEARSRTLLQRILHTLLDRRANAPRLLRATVDYIELGLIVEKCSRQDLIFISKHGYALFSSLYEGLQLESNTMENVEAIYTTLALICIELGSEETVCDIMQLILAIQQSSISNPVLTVAQQCQLHAISVALAALLPHVMMLPRLADYIHKVMCATCSSQQSRCSSPGAAVPAARHQPASSPGAAVQVQQCQLHAISVALAALLPHVMMLPRLADYIHKVMCATCSSQQSRCSSPGAAVPAARHQRGAGGAAAARHDAAAPRRLHPQAASSPGAAVQVQQCQLHAISVALAALLPHVMMLPRLADYIHKVMCATCSSQQSRCSSPGAAVPAARHQPASSPGAAVQVQQCQLHAISVALAALLPHVMMLPRLADYIHKIIAARREEAPHMLPPLLEDYDELPPSKMPNKLPYLMMDQMALCEILKSHGIDSSRLASNSPYAAGNVAAPHRHSWVEAGAAQGRDSLAEITAPGTELDSANSSPGVQRSSGSGGGVSLEALRRAATGPGAAERRDAERRRATLNNAFRTAPFDQLLHITQPKYEIKDKLEEIFNSISSEPLLAAAPACSPHKPYASHVPPYTKYFPELFLY
ncbi:hypothetical protein PYW07_009338 [Mythimna separata]|uniref:EFR3-like protein n=1 Tax=Mythimna separata TaxID=271217 RepID=A0AAD8DN70_MYTSE|nr:hypothetical protein PYW07_009338 [Mythimna separata]